MIMMEGTKYMAINQQGGWKMPKPHAQQIPQPRPGSPIREMPQSDAQSYANMLTGQDLDGAEGNTNASGNGGGGGGGGQPARYDPAKFIVPGSDSQGHSERAQCRVPPEMLRQVEVILKSRKFPFRTNGDIYRWGIYVGLKLLDIMEPTPNTYMSRMEASNEIIRSTIYLHEYQETVRQLDGTVQRLVSDGATGQAKRLIATVRAQFLKIDEEFWRDKLVKELDGRFGHLMNVGGVQGAKLTADENND